MAVTTDVLFTAFDEAIGAMDQGLRLVDVEWLPSRGGARLVVTVARPEGRVSLDDCSAVTVALDSLVEENADLGGPFVLEVSSPGLDRTLKRRHEYQVFRGREATLWLDRMVEGRQEWTGVLRDQSGDLLVIEVNGVPVSLPLEAIVKAKLAFKFK